MLGGDNFFFSDDFREDFGGRPCPLGVRGVSVTPSSEMLPETFALDRLVGDEKYGEDVSN